MSNFFEDVQVIPRMSYTGNSCFDTPLVIGYYRVLLPPAKTIPFIMCELFF